jgi:hypothetical protein
VKRLAYLVPVLAFAACAHARTQAEYSADTGNALSAKDPDIKGCYDKVLATTPKAAGHVTVKFAVEAKTGKIVDPQLDAAKTTAPQDVSQCVLGAVSTASITPGDRNRGEAIWSWDFNAPAGQ